MAYQETAKEKEKRQTKEAGWKADAEKKAAKKEYEMFGTTEQNIPKVDTMGNVTGMKKGGSASARADGIAQRGKTRGKMIMCGGGKA